jgi:hypothetical protein
MGRTGRFFLFGIAILAAATIAVPEIAFLLLAKPATRRHSPTDRGVAPR